MGCCVASVESIGRAIVKKTGLLGYNRLK